MSNGLIQVSPGELANEPGFAVGSSSSSEAVHLPPHQRQRQQQTLVGSGSAHTLQSAVERRFGLFKKHNFGATTLNNGQYGTPISANYLAGYMSDCERCLASLGGQQSAELQQLDPPAVQPQQPPFQPAPQPSSPILHNHLQSFGQPFAPLKNKLLMKFPFFVKTISSFDPYANGGAQVGVSPAASNGHLLQQQAAYGWHSIPHSYQPQTRPSQSAGAALFLRPNPAYNCFQTNAPHQLYASASSTNQESIQIPSSGKTSHRGKTSSLASHSANSGGEPFPIIHQQSTYASSQY